MYFDELKDKPQIALVKNSIADATFTKMFRLNVISTNNFYLVNSFQESLIKYRNYCIPRRERERE